MRILALGSGVIGITTAWFLAGDGHEVTVIERERAWRSAPATPTAR